MADREALLGSALAPPKGGRAAPAEGATPGAKAEPKPKTAPKTPEQKEADKQAAATTKMLAGNQKVIDKWTSDSEKPCYYFHTASCGRATDCFFGHAPISKEEKAKLVKPEPRSRAPSPAQSEPKGKGKGKPKADTYCFVFHEKGHYAPVVCIFAHLNQN